MTNDIDYSAVHLMEPGHPGKWKDLGHINTNSCLCSENFVFSVFSVLHTRKRKEGKGREERKREGKGKKRRKRRGGKGGGEEDPGQDGGGKRGGKGGTVGTLLDSP